MKKYKDTIFFSVLFGLTLFIFRKSFTMGLFQDDFFFLKKSNISSFMEFINFFNPLRDVFYRPLSSEVFYYMIHLSGSNLIFGRIIVFLTYFFGLFYLFKIMSHFFSQKIGIIITFIYAINFTHVFQLYWFATYQEVLLFTLCLLTFYLWINNKKKGALFIYIFALLSKETAFFLSLIIVSYELYLSVKKKRKIKVCREVLFLIVISAVMLFIYKIGGSNVVTLENYSIKLNPKLVINNFIWYGFWSLGFPNFMPIYSSSFFRPLPEFWNIISKSPYNLYFFLMIIFNIVIIFLIMLFLFIKKTRKTMFSILAISLTIFIIFIFPSFFIIHRWMVRLTMSFIGIAIIYGWVLSKFMFSKSSLLKIFSIIFLFIYVSWNYFGVQVHESSGLFNQEKNIFSNAKVIFRDINSKKLTSLFIKDNKNDEINPLSKTLYNSFHDQDALDYFFPNRNIKIIYDFNALKEPSNSVIINSDIFFK